MNVIETRLKRWGNSFGVVVPVEFVSSENIRENEKIRVLVLRDSKKAFKKTFGTGKGKIKKSAQEFKDEARRELY